MTKSMKTKKLWKATDIKPMTQEEGKRAYSKILTGSRAYRCNSVKRIPGKCL